MGKIIDRARERRRLLESKARQRQEFNAYLDCARAVAEYRKSMPPDPYGMGKSQGLGFLYACLFGICAFIGLFCYILFFK